VAAAAPTVAAVLEPWWADRRFQLPGAFVAATLLATATFAGLYFALREKPDRETGDRDERGWKFPELGYVLCPQGAGLRPTDKPIEAGSIIVVGLGSPTGQSVEAAWAKVAGVDPRDPNRIAVVLVGQASETGQVELQTDRHGFRLSQRLWITRDCVWDVLRFLDDPQGRLLCGAELSNFDGPDADVAPDGYKPAPPPIPLASALGRHVELLLVSRAAAGTAWVVPLTAEVTAISETKHIATVRVTAVGRNEDAEGASGHHVRAGTTFDITWDCVLQYR
jgi:hypothetical protein